VTVSSVGDVVVFSCQLHGTPTPRTHWYHDSRLIASADDERYAVHNDSDLSVLEIHSVRYSDAGYFRCEAGNGVEQSVASRFARLSFNATTSPTNHCV